MEKMFCNSAYRKVVRLMGRGRDSPNNNNNEEPEYEYGSVPEHLRDVCWVKEDEHLKRNGAWLFEELVKSTRGKNNSIRIFSLKEIQKATNNFSADLILIDFSNPTYRGIIGDRHVAVKITSGPGVMGNEVVSLSLIKHRNVVKLLGCCLETEYPIVVHELPPNGSLGKYIFPEKLNIPPPVELLWTDILRIATEIADALSHLHSQLHMTHGRLWDPQAVLLDEFHSAKLGAFGSSKIQTEAESSDVETNNIRKLDVYEFGNILTNLLIDILIDERCYKVEIVRNLIDIRILISKRCDKVEILEYIKLNVSEKVMPQIDAYIDLLLRCQSSDKVPSMEEVARELRRIRSMINHQPTTDGNESDNLSSGAN